MAHKKILKMLYTKQDFVHIELDTFFPLDEAEEGIILYEQPNGRRGAWKAEIEDTKLVYRPKVTDITIPGIWIFQAKVQIGGRTALGARAYVQIDESL